MRPVDKGPCPYEAISKYQEAKDFLLQRIGEYCSYCEMQLSSGLAVEHVQPKSRHHDKECEWENLLLACFQCNSTKGYTDINDNNINNYLWPDIHNTFLALQYSEAGVVSVNSSLNPDIQAKAQRLISLVGLDKTPDAVHDNSDKRWIKRKEAWEKAKIAKERIQKCNCEEMRSQVADTAEACGFFSIWMTVFSNDADMKTISAKHKGKNCIVFNE